jgi:hypothetical protein
MYSTIDAGAQSSGGQTDATSVNLYRRRYGFIGGSTSATQDYGTPLSLQGNPDQDSVVNHPVWAGDEWNHVLVYVNNNTQTVRLWHAVRGDLPVLVINADGTADLGNRAGNYTGVQLVFRLEDKFPDEANRLDTFAVYSELIASDDVINFPGGFVPPGA